MSKLKGIQQAAEKVKGLNKANDAAKVAGRAPPVDEGEIDKLFQEYSQIQQAVRQGDEGATVPYWEAQMMGVMEKGDPQARARALFDPEVDTNLAYINQTSNPEEFRDRFNKQFRDRDFTIKTAWDNDPNNPGLFSPDWPQVRENMGQAAIEDLLFQHTTSFKVFNELRNPRLRRAAMEWMGDTSPYRRTGKNVQHETPYIFVHMDRWADPLRPLATSEDPIQFSTQANELGMHSGTYRAAEQAAVRDITEVMYRHQEFEEDIETFSNMSELAGLTKEELQSMIIETANNYLVDSFKTHGKTGWNQIGQGLQDTLNQILLEVGVPNPSLEAARFLRHVRDIPMPSSTPHLFRGKNGLYLKDMGGFGPETVGMQLRQIYPDDADFIDTILGGKDQTKGLRKFIEDKGFDHVIYHNSAEDKGSISIINWNPDLWMPLYDARLHNSADSQAGAMAAFALGLLGMHDADIQQDIEGET